MDMPQPTEAHKRLELIAGNWVGTDTMHPSPWAPEGSTAEGRSNIRMALGGYAAIGDYEQSREGKTTFTGHSVYGYDPKEDCYVLTWFDCMAGAAEIFRGNFEGDVLTMSSQTGDGRTSRFTADYSEPGVVLTKMEMSEDGENWKPLMDSEYRRQD